MRGAIALAIAATSASAAATRAEYVAQVDPICQSATNPARKAFAACFKAVRSKPGGAEAITHPKVVIAL